MNDIFVTYTFWPNSVEGAGMAETKGFNRIISTMCWLI